MASSLHLLQEKPTIHHIAIGMFDGVHLGHQAVLKHLLSQATSAEETAILTFEPHPLDVIAPQQAPPRLTTEKQRTRLIHQLGIPHVIPLAFDANLRQLNADDFIAELHRLFPHLARISIGENWVFGHDRQGSPALLKKWGRSLGFEVHTVGNYHLQGSVVSSTRIRQIIAEGHLSLAAELLGREYAIEGIVVQGSQRGRTLGFPTANLDSINQLLPPPGVYTGKTQWKGSSLPTVINIGHRPTFEVSSKLTLEAHLLDFQKDLYGQTLELSHFRLLRKEKKYESAQALQSQIQQDIEIARSYFACNSSTSIKERS